MNATEKKIISIIADHYFVTGSDKITLQEVATKAGISRQAFNKYYPHLKEFVQGRKPIAELLSPNGASDSKYLFKSQKSIQELSAKIDQLKQEHQREIKEIEKSYITSLMSNDIIIHATNDVRVLADKKSLQVDKLTQDVSRLKAELLLEREKSAIDPESKKQNSTSKKISKIPVDFGLAYRSFVESGDIEALEANKRSICEGAIGKTSRKLKSHEKSRICFFVERYLFDFDECFKSITADNSINTFWIRLPVFSRVELRSLRALLKLPAYIEVYIPFATSDALIKANRSFYFRNIPTTEFIAADKMDFPNANDGFSKIVFFNVGDFV